MANGQRLDGTPPNWANAPQLDNGDFHDQGGQAWRYDNRGVSLQSDPGTIVRSHGEPVTVRAILASYGAEIFGASVKHRIPPELIVMTIATETGDLRSVNFTGPRSFRWEPSQTSYSGGPMQVLETTARDLIIRLRLDFSPGDIPPHFTAKPNAPPSINPLYDGEVNIELGTGFISLHQSRTGLDPILVAACYNHGSLGRTTPNQANPWGLITAGDHLNRSAQWFGDACAVLSELRQGQALDTSEVIAAPPTIDTDDQDSDELEIQNLTQGVADQEKAFYEDSGATVTKIDEEGGFVTLVVTYDQPAQAPAPVRPAPTPPTPTQPPPPATSDVQPPDEDGFVICIDRKSTQLRNGKGFRRTIGLYQAFFDRQPIAGISGTAVERQGPGNNTNTGVAQHARLAQRKYSLFTHAGAQNKYRTLGYANPGGIKIRPWPCILIGDTGARSGVLIHCAAGYLMSIGCINLTGRQLAGAGDDIDFSDSRDHVIRLIQSMKTHLGNQFPSSNEVKIQNASLVIRGEP
jgi:hypothetical protein